LAKTRVQEQAQYASCEVVADIP